MTQRLYRLICFTVSSYEKVPVPVLRVGQASLFDISALTVTNRYLLHVEILEGVQAHFLLVGMVGWIGNRILVGG